jgi:hypothetical protein
MPRGAKKDLQATRLAKFNCPASFIATDGRPFLKGSDMSEQRRKVWERCDARCEHLDEAKTVRCDDLIHWDTFHTHHLRERGKGGSDDLWNLAAYCARHHLEAHKARNPRWTPKGDRE